MAEGLPNDMSCYEHRLAQTLPTGPCELTKRNVSIVAAPYNLRFSREPAGGGLDFPTCRQRRKAWPFQALFLPLVPY